MSINNSSTTIVDNGIYNPNANSVGDGISNIGTSGGGGTPTNAYVAENGTTNYVAENGTTYYVRES